VLFRSQPKEGIMAHVNPIQVQKFLKGVDYPASKAELLDKAKSMGADENIRASLEQLPDEDFQTPADVSQAFGRLAQDEAEPAARQAPQAKHKPRQQAKSRDDAKDADREQPRHTGGNEFLIQAMQDAMAEIQIC